MDKGKKQIEVFVRDSKGVMVSCGQYETFIENYVLCVQVPGVVLWPIREIHVEFKKSPK